MGHGTVTVTSLETVSRNGGSCQQNITSEVEPESRSTPIERTIQHLVKEINQNQDQSILANQWGNQKRFSTILRFNHMSQLRHVIKAEDCGEDVSNMSNINDWTPQILHNQLRVALTPDERNYQELKREREKESDTRTQPTVRFRESKRETGRTLMKVCFNRVLQQIPDPMHCPVKIESDITRICAGRWGPPQSRGRERKRERGVGGLRERLRVLEVLLASKKESEQTRDKKSERREKEWEKDPLPHEVKGGKEKKERGKTTERENERASKGNWDQKQQRQSTQERERDREYDVTRAANSSTQWHAVTERLSLPIQIHAFRLTVKDYWWAFL